MTTILWFRKEEKAGSIQIGLFENSAKHQKLWRAVKHTLLWKDNSLLREKA